MALKRNILILFTVFSLLASVDVNRPSQAAGDLPVAHGQIIHNYARLTFEWPSTVYFTAKAKNRTLTITFDRKADPDIDALLAQIRPYVQKAVRKPDGRTFVLTLDKPYRIRTFVSDNINGIDLLEIDVAARERYEERLQEQQAAQMEEPAEAIEKALKPAPAVKPLVAKNEPSPQKLAALAPAAGPETAPAEQPAAKAQPPTAAAPVAEATPTPAPAAEAAPAPAAPIPAPATSFGDLANPPAATPAAVPEPAATPAPAETTEQPAQAEVPTPPVIPAAPGTPVMLTNEGDDTQVIPPGEVPANRIAKPNGLFKISVSAATDNAVLRFPFTDRKALAVFMRAHTLWVVVHAPLTVDLSDFKDLPRTVISKPDIVATAEDTIMRFPIEDGVYPALAQEDNGFQLAILITPKKRPIPSALPITISTDPPAPAHVFVPALEITNPITLKDPTIGDALVITPVYNLGEGIGTAREFIEFSLLETTQGIVINKKADEVAVTPMRNGIRISMPNGATLTPGLPDIASMARNASLNIVTLYPYNYWKLENPDTMWMQVRELFHRVVETENPQESNGARLRLAQIFLSQGMAPEAVAQLDGIRRTNPAYYRSAKLNALRGAANFLMYRFNDAQRDFASVELNNNKEMDFWRSMIADLLGAPDQSYDYLAFNQDYISKYPPIFRQRLAIVAADRAISNREYNVALKVFDSLSQEKLLDPINNYVQFLMAKISADTGQIKEAEAAWDKLAADFKHPYVQARAEFSRIAWEMEHATLQKDKAIDRLERLRLAWHGDSLELQVLTLLGDLYVERQDYVNAMRIWNGGVISFPNTATAIDMSRRMQEAFITIFNEGTVDKLPPLDALALYYEYRNYMPSGNTGNAMLERLADRLLGMDLLEQAAVVLDHQMRGQAEKEQRSRLGTKLATVYLLNHQPQKALGALQDSMYGENPLMLRLLRNRLTAQAMTAMGQSEKALATLGQDDSPEAERVRLSIYWRQKDWQRVITNVEGMLKARSDLTAPITLEESEYLLELALAYVFQNDTQQLQYLHDYFGPLMAQNPNKPVFDFVTSGDMKLTTTNFDQVVQNLSDTRQFIENYRARLTLSSLNTATPSP